MNDIHTRDSSADAAPVISGRKLVIVLLLILAATILLAGIGIFERHRAAKTLSRETSRMAIPTVLSIQPRQGNPAQEIVLPGSIQAFEDAPIYARTSGYLKKWYADIGTRVKKGQLLAEIESPEIDQQLQQGEADLAVSQANLQISKATAARYQDLLKSDSVSKQDTENAMADARAKQAMVDSSQANVRRLQQLQDFEKVTAPFDGIITARDTDVGQLISSGSNGTGTGSITGAGASSAGHELFHIASVRTLRVYVNVPQIYSRSAAAGTQADLTLAEFPGRKFHGKVVRNSNAIDPVSRTLLVEIDVNNATGDLLPGAYAEVHLKIDSQVSTILLPVSALIFRTQGLQVGTVKDNHAHLQKITLGRDLGNEVEVVFGLEPGQWVIDNPPDSLVENEEVRVTQGQPDNAGNGAEGR